MADCITDSNYSVFSCNLKCFLPRKNIPENWINEREARKSRREALTREIDSFAIIMKETSVNCGNSILSYRGDAFVPISSSVISDDCLLSRSVVLLNFSFSFFRYSTRSWQFFPFRIRRIRWRNSLKIHGNETALRFSRAFSLLLLRNPRNERDESSRQNLGEFLAVDSPSYSA